MSDGFEIPQSFVERHKRFVGLFAIGIAVVTLSLVYWIADIADSMKFDPPKWLGFVLGGGFLLVVFSEFFAVIWGLADLIHRFIPEGRFKAFLTYDSDAPKGEKPKMKPDEYGEAAFAMAVWPMYGLIGLAVIGAVILLFVGGVAALSAIGEKVFAGWPPWAIVICILLLAIYFKNSKR